MKNLFGSLKSRESKLNSIEFLTNSDMQKIRGGAERPISRPREILDWDKL